MSCNIRTPRPERELEAKTQATRVSEIPSPILIDTRNAHARQSCIAEESSLRRFRGESQNMEHDICR